MVNWNSLLDIQNGIEAEKGAVAMIDNHKAHTEEELYYQFPEPGKDLQPLMEENEQYAKSIDMHQKKLGKLQQREKSLIAEHKHIS